MVDALYSEEWRRYGIPWPLLFQLSFIRETELATHNWPGFFAGKGIKSSILSQRELTWCHIEECHHRAPQGWAFLEGARGEHRRPRPSPPPPQPCAGIGWGSFLRRVCIASTCTSLLAVQVTIVSSLCWSKQCRTFEHVGFMCYTSSFHLHSYILNIISLFG